jgi:NADPH-dependent curcumin reductase CurA
VCSPPATYRQWVYARPMADGVLRPEQFALREAPMPQPAPGEALVRVKLLNIHAATRSRLASGAVPLGATDPHGYACAQVLASRDPTFREGDLIACQAGWQDHQLIRSADPSVGYGPASEAVRALNRTHSQWTYVFRPEMARRWRPPVLMDVFGTSGMTAFFGLRQCGPLRSGEVVLVAAASGAVGSLVVQLAKAAGCRVVGLAGGEARCRWVEATLGADLCLDYRGPDLGDRLRAALPDGVAVFSDGVGGDLTVLAAGLLKPGGRLLAYGGAAAQYAAFETTPSARPASLRQAFVPAAAEPILAARSIQVEAWIVHDFYHQRLEAEDALSGLLEAGALKPVHNTVEGFEALPEAIVSLYDAPRAGKLQVRFA